MATLTETATFMADPAAVQPMLAGVYQAALVIFVEDPTIDQHTARAALARLALQNPYQVATYFVNAASTYPAIVDDWIAGNHDAAVLGFPAAITATWTEIAAAFEG